VSAAAAGLALLAAGSAQPHSSKAPPLLGVVEARAPFETLVRVDARHLRQVRRSREVDLGYSSYTWAFSPDRTLIAFGRDGDHEPGDIAHAPSFLRIVDPFTMRIRSEISLGPGIILGAPAWLSANRIATMKIDCCSDRSELVVADPTDSRVVDRRQLPSGSPLAEAQRRGRFVVVAGTRNGIAPVQLVVVESDGTIRSVALDRINGGVENGVDTVTTVRPAVALSRDGKTAFVVAAGGMVAEVDLASLAVTYHQVPLPAVLRGKVDLGSVRRADVLPTGTLVVTGYDIGQVEYEGQEVPEKTSAGLWLVNTTTWTSHQLNRYADSFCVAGSLVLATGWHLNTRTQVAHGIGLNAYTLAGKRHFRLFSGKSVDVYWVYRGRAYFEAESPDVIVVDLRRGRVVGSRFPWTLPLLVTP